MQVIHIDDHRIYSIFEVLVSAEAKQANPQFNIIYFLRKELNGKSLMV